MKQKRIEIFHNLPPGGAKRVVYEEVKLFSKKYFIDLYQFSTNERDFVDFTSLPCKIFEYSFNFNTTLPRFLSRLSSDYKMLFSLSHLHKKLAADIDKNNYDAVVVHPDKYTQAPYILKYLKTKSIYYCEELLRIAYDDYFSFPANISLVKKFYEKSIRIIKKIIDRKNAQAADIILANSEYTKANIKLAYGKIAKVCYLGVDTNLFKPVRNEKKDTILFIGAPAEINGYALLETVMNNNPEIKKRVKIINFFDNKSSLSENELLFAYSQAIVTLCLSYREPFGLIPLESLACETPVIAVNEGGYRESIINTKTGYLIRRDPEELTKRILQLMNNPLLVTRLGTNGRNHVKSNWTWEKHITQLGQYF